MCTTDITLSDLTSAVLGLGLLDVEPEELRGEILVFPPSRFGEMKRPSAERMGLGLLTTTSEGGFEAVFEGRLPRFRGGGA